MSMVIPSAPHKVQVDNKISEAVYFRINILYIPLLDILMNIVSRSLVSLIICCKMLLYEVYSFVVLVL